MAESSEKGEGISRSGEDETAPLKAGPSNSGSSVQPCSPKPGPSNSGISKEGASKSRKYEDLSVEERRSYWKYKEAEEKRVRDLLQQENFQELRSYEPAPNPLLMPTDSEHHRKRFVDCIFHPSY